MGMIQNSINQMIGTAGIAARLDPNVETRAELRKTNKGFETLKAQTEALGTPELPAAESLTEESLVDLQATLDIETDLYKKGEELAKKRFELDPSKETAEAYKEFSKSAKQGISLREDIMKNAKGLVETKKEAEALKNKLSDLEELKARMEAAQAKSKAKQQVKTEQKREYKSFKKALMSQPEVSALGEKAREAVYEQTKGNKAFRQEVISKHYGNK